MIGEIDTLTVSLDIGLSYQGGGTPPACQGSHPAYLE